MTTAQVLANINDVQDQLANTQQELSTGKSINQPSDNPYGASLAISLHQDMAGLTNYNDNVTDGTAWTSAGTTALQSVQSMLQRVQELVVEASNGAESPSDLAASAAEVNQLTDAIKQAANTQYDGQYIFSGTATSTAPYSTATGDVYQGNTGQVNREIGPGSQLPVNVDLSSLLGSGQSAADGKLLDTLRSVAADMSGGTAADVNDLQANQLNNLS
ncbi:MAG: flagellar hook-associated protein FlgL, partial [Solirubrobacteraceae bacterium]